MQRFDVLLVGAGCAGLSLASRLVGSGLRVLLLDARQHFGADRTWCFWDIERHGFEAAIAHRWPRQRVRHDGQERVLADRRVHYVCIPSTRFYEVALERIAGDACITLQLDEAVTAIEEGGDGVRVTTERGTYEASVVYDSRPPNLETPPPLGSLRLLQHFVGHVVQTERPCFDASTATLMDFDVPAAPGLHFVYVLPFSAQEALVEATWFSPSTLPRATYEDAIAFYLRERLGQDRYAVRSVEQGILPMSTEVFPSTIGPRVFRIGVGGGLAKPTTGYAFMAIQRQSERLAQALREGRYAPPPPRSARTELIDRTFLQWLATHEQEGPALFHRLFSRVPAGKLARFLSESSTFLEDLRVMREVPWGDFLLAGADALATR